MRLAEIESRRAHQIADVPMNNRPPAATPMIQGVADHMRIEMAALAGVDLHCRSAGGADPLGVARSLLVAFDHGDRPSVLQVVDRANQQRRLAGAGARDEVERETHNSCMPRVPGTGAQPHPERLDDDRGVDRLQKHPRDADLMQPDGNPSAHWRRC